MMCLVVSKYGAFYVCESLKREGNTINCTNAWMITKNKANKFYHRCCFKGRGVNNVIEESIFTRESSHEEIYTFLKKNGLVRSTLMNRVEGI